MELHEMSALDLAATIRRREVSVTEVTEAALARAESVGVQVGAFAHLTPEHALAEAAARDAELASWPSVRAGAGTAASTRDSGTAASSRATSEAVPTSADNALVFGVPVPVKDLNQVKGLPFEGGSALLKGNIAQVTDGVAQLLQSAGTVMLGKTSAPEFGFPAYTEPAGLPAARTPWDTRRTAGGSSGGAASAVAAGVVPVAQASDGGGSIRIPAAATGTVGLKPSRGRISSGPYSVDSVGLVTNGVITRTVRDSAAFLDVLSRPFPGDAFPTPQVPDGGFLAALDRPHKPVRIGLLLEPLNVDEVDLHPEAIGAAHRAARLLEARGHIISPAPRPMTGADWMTFMPLWFVAAATLPIPDDAAQHLMPLTAWLRELGKTFTGADVANAISGMQMLSRRLAEAWNAFDVILTPTLSGPPPFPYEIQLPDPAEDFEAQKRLTPWTSVWNMTGAPSISLPIHRAWVADETVPAGGLELPFGAMLGAVRQGDEALLLSLAAQIEEDDPWPHVIEPRVY